MGVRQKKIAAHDLAVGMFVSDLDRPWHETPFPIQGFHIRSEDEIRALVSYCRHVFVDVAESRGSVAAESAEAPIFTRRGKNRGGSQSLKLPPVHIRNPKEYTASVPLKKEIRDGEKALADAGKALAAVMDQLACGEMPDLKQARAAASAMTQSILRNPDALLWLTRVQRHDEYSYQHALNAAVWSLVFGRHLGLESNVLEHLATGTLLAHVGKIKLPKALIERETMLEADEFEVFKTYVSLGAGILEEQGLPEPVLNVVRFHRERHNGSGFPGGLTGDRIPLLAKIAGLVDHYESLIEPRPGQTPLSPAQAVSSLYESRNIEFQEDLVERFIQAVGVYPTGTLIELNTSQVAVVLSHRPNRRLWPKVLVMTDSQGQPLKTGKIVDLAQYNEGRSLQEALQIRGCMPFGTADVDPCRYEVTGATSRWSWQHLVG